MASSPSFIGTAKSTTAQISTANTARDGTGTLGTVYTAGASGGRVDVINITATGTTTAGMIRLFMSDASATWLVKEVPVVAITPSATQPAFSVDVVFDQGLILQGTYLIKAGTNNAETFNVTIVNGGDF